MKCKIFTGHKKELENNINEWLNEFKPNILFISQSYLGYIESDTCVTIFYDREYIPTSL